MIGRGRYDDFAIRPDPREPFNRKPPFPAKAGEGVFSGEKFGCIQILIYRAVSRNAKGSAKGTGTSSARKTLQWSVFSEMGPAGPTFPSDRRERFRGRWQPEGLSEEVVLLEESTQTVDTAGGPTSSGASRHLPLKGKASEGRFVG